jgi:hypothetical protein
LPSRPEDAGEICELPHQIARVDAEATEQPPILVGVDLVRELLAGTLSFVVVAQMVLDEADDRALIDLHQASSFHVIRPA